MNRKFPRRIAIIRLGLTLLTGWIGHAEAIEDTKQEYCSPTAERSAEDQVGRLKSWTEVYDAYLRFRHCDDGSIGQGFSESITTLLAERWDRFDDLARLAAKEEKFEAFVIRHIDLTVPVERLEIIVKRAQQQCGAVRSICERIAKRASER
jgi:hypothetical protein